jgi:hypothetical protein
MEDDIQQLSRVPELRAHVRAASGLDGFDSAVGVVVDGLLEGER